MKALTLVLRSLQALHFFSGISNELYGSKSVCKRCALIVSLGIVYCFATIMKEQHGSMIYTTLYIGLDILRALILSSTVAITSPDIILSFEIRRPFDNRQITSVFSMSHLPLHGTHEPLPVNVKKSHPKQSSICSVLKVHYPWLKSAGCARLSGVELYHSRSFFRKGKCKVTGEY